MQAWLDLLDYANTTCNANEPREFLGPSRAPPSCGIRENPRELVGVENYYYR
jgi:hypothetical protein